MTGIDRRRAFEEALRILGENDRGDYTIPTRGLYPFQWNWDSCLAALGLRYLDEARAWCELETLLAHQWADGMVPHIVFHVDDEGYFRGPEVWAAPPPIAAPAAPPPHLVRSPSPGPQGMKTPTSGITQPPVLGYVLKRLFDEAHDRRLAEEKARSLVPKAAAWHRWFYAVRDPGGTGLVAIIHPWESGRDNSIDWIEALARVPTEGVAPYRRRDTGHVDAAQRPTQAEYDRYIWLVQHFRTFGWENSELHDASPFRVVDPGFNAILVRADADIAVLAEALGEREIAVEARARVAKASRAFEALWSPAYGQYVCLDRATGALVDSPSVGGLLPIFAGLGDVSRQRALTDRVGEWRAHTQFGVASHDPSDPRFEPRRYWRGPCWLIINSMIADGLARSGLTEEADAINGGSLALLAKGGFAEYYDPLTGEGLGGRRFTWTAAMVADLLKSEES